MTCQPSTGPCMKRSEKRRKEEEEGEGRGARKRGNETLAVISPLPLGSSCPYFSYKHGTTRFHFDLTLSNSFVPLAQNGSFEHPTRREQSEGKLSLVSSFVLPLPTLFLAALRGLDDSFFFLLPSFPSSLPLFSFEISLRPRQEFNISKHFVLHIFCKNVFFYGTPSFGSRNLSAQFAQFAEIGSQPSKN